VQAITGVGPRRATKILQAYGILNGRLGGRARNLIPIDISNAQEPRVNARDLHARLESKQDFSTWVKNRVEQCDLFENEHYGVFNKFIVNPAGGRWGKITPHSLLAKFGEQRMRSGK
jgi:hypothetical protein